MEVLADREPRKDVGLIIVQVQSIVCDIALAWDNMYENLSLSNLPASA